MRECVAAECRARLVCSGCCVEVEGILIEGGNEEEEVVDDGGGHHEHGDGSKLGRSGDGDRRQQFRGDGVFCWDCLDGG